jgi:hypothetical protein
VVPFSTTAYARIAALPRILPGAYQAIDAAINRPESLRDEHREDTFGRAAPIVVLAYPSLTPAVTENPGFCPQLGTAELRFTNEFQHRLNSSIAESVGKAHAAGVPIFFASDVMDALSAHRTICDRDPHVVTVSAADLASGNFASRHAVQEIMHPDANGYAAMTASLVRWSARSPVASQTVRRQVSSSAPQAGTQPSSGATVEVAPVPPSGLASLDGGHSSVVSGDGFMASAPVTVVLQTVPTAVGHGLTDAQGRLDVNMSLPADVQPGPHTVIVYGWDAAGHPRFAYAVVTVTRPFSWWPWLILGLAVLLMAAATIWWLYVRRRRQRQTGSQHHAQPAF